MSPTEVLHVIHAITWSCNNELPLNETFNNKISDALQPLRELLNPPGNFVFAGQWPGWGRGSPRLSHLHELQEQLMIMFLRIHRSKLTSQILP